MPTINTCDYSPTNFLVQAGDTNGRLQDIPTGTLGQQLTSQGAGALPIWASPASSPGPFGLTWVTLTSVVPLLADHGYLLEIYIGGAGQTDLFLPSAPPNRTIVAVVSSPFNSAGNSTANWRINASGTDHLYMYGQNAIVFTAVSIPNSTGSIFLYYDSTSGNWASIMVGFQNSLSYT